MTDTPQKPDLRSLTLSELSAALTALGEPAYRAGQVYKWLHSAMVAQVEAMSNLPLALRTTLREQFVLTTLTVKAKQQSAKDGTVKYLFQLPDGQCVEAVLMQYRHGASLCISTQVGCRMGCAFCASTIGGLVRNLTAGEMLEQVYAATRDSGNKIGSLVLMGIGEPLDNYDNVLRFLRMLSAPEGLNMSLRHVSLSTCGLVEQIDKLAEEKLGLTLSVSLHSATDDKRSKIMPINKRYNIDTLLAASKRYFIKTGRRVSFEYSLIQGVNDTPADAKALADKLRSFGCHVNLIPINQVAECGYRKTAPKEVEAFKHILEQSGITATVRRELGTDISAACGQLRRERANEQGGTLHNA